MKAELINYMGDDLTTVNAARVSFDSFSTELTKKDIGLINFLARGCSSGEWNANISLLTANDIEPDDAEEVVKWARNMPTHWTPFSHAQITLRETIPIYIARQRFKHTIGFTYNEVSRRYVDDTPDFHIPSEWRSRPDKNIKQGSGDTHPDSDYFAEKYNIAVYALADIYRQMVESNVAPEQARMILPQSLLTSYWVTGSLYAWARAYIQRSDSHAQREIQELASQWDEIIRPLYPYSWSALVD